MFILVKDPYVLLFSYKGWDMGRLVLFQILKLQYDLLRVGSCFKSCKYSGLQPGPPKFSSIWTSLCLVASSHFYSMREGGLSCWKVIKSLVPRSPWDDRGQDFWEAVDSSAVLGEMGALCLFLKLTSATAAETTRRRPWTCANCSSEETDWHLGRFQLFLNWGADKRTHCLFTTRFPWLFSLQILRRVLFTSCQWCSFVIMILL